MTEFCGGSSLKLVYGQDSYEFTINQTLAVPDELANALLQPDRACGFGVFVEVP